MAVAARGRGGAAEARRVPQPKGASLKGEAGPALARGE
jgi:hypothetical protein